MDFRHYFDNPFERNVMDIEYSVLGHFCNWNCPEGNTELHFRKSIELGFDGLKADMRFTKDGEIVLCHDPGFTLDADGKIVLFDNNNYVAFRDMTLDQTLALEFAATYEGKRQTPCTLDTMLAICREHDMAAYLTLRPEPWRDEVAKRMCELILKHNMQGLTIINLYPGCIEAKDFVNNLIPNMVYCNTRLPNDALTTELIDESAAQGYNIICICRRMIETVTPEKCCYAASRGIHVWDWEATTAKDAESDLARGITGFQMFNNEATVSVIKALLSKLPPTL